MNILPKSSASCPYLIVAPMEGVGDRSFRQAMALVGGFDEAVTDFLRVPSNAYIPSLARAYDALETYPIPLAAQLMGSNPELLATMAQAIEKRGAPRIDLNCGCPSNTVTGRAAGSSLLKEPKLLYTIAKAMVKAVSVPVTIKMRSGFLDTSLFKENLFAAQESGVAFITLHPRTKVEGYGPKANWQLIAEAKALLNIPVVGNGDILTVDDALRMLAETSCDALMIGRGSVIDPFIFKRIKAHFHKQEYRPRFVDLEHFIKAYLDRLFEATPKVKMGKMKQLMGFLFKKNLRMLEHRQRVLSSTYEDANAFTDFALTLLEELFDGDN